MSVDEKHPKYSLQIEDWQQMSDTYAGERTVKEARETYLFPTANMVADGMTNPNQPGWKAYEAYMKRAVYHDFVKDAINMMVDIMNRKSAQIKLPAKMEPLRDKITAEGHSLKALMRDIHFHQLLHSRFGLLVDVRSGEGPNALPYIATYEAKNIINWDMGRREDNRSDLDFLVLEETEMERQHFKWEKQDKYRVLLSPTSEMVGLLDPRQAKSGRADRFWAVPVRGKGGLLSSAVPVQPMIAGRGLPYIPFTFINAADLESEPETPVLIGLSNLTLAIYRGEADYRQTLFMQGQDTLVIIGSVIDDEEDNIKVGSGARIEVPLGGDAKYIGVSADGLQEQREALKADKEQAAERGARLLDFGDTARQSGDALRIRVAARTTTLRTLAITAAEGLQRSLRQIAEFVGANPKEVEVEPNLDFTDDAFTGQDILEYMQAKALGAPLSLKTIHTNFRKKELTEKTFEEEMEEIDGERELTLGTVLDITKEEPAAAGGDNPDRGRGKPQDPRQKTDRTTPGPNKTTDN